MGTRTGQRPSIGSIISSGWRLLSLAAAGVLALAVYVGSTITENPYTALVASIGVGPLLVLPMTRRLVWLVLASVAGLALTAAILWSSL